MYDLDDLLQKELEALEEGKPLETVLAELPQEASELASLLRIASTIRELPHPQPATVMARAELESAMINEKTRPVANPRILNPTPRILSPQPRILMPELRILEDQLRILGAQLRIWFTPLRLGVALSMAGAAFVMLLALVALFAMGPTGARAATVMDVNGLVRVAAGPSANNWKPVSDGDRVHSGQSIVTGPDSTMTLVFFEGSRMTLSPNSYVTLTKLDGNWGKSLRLIVTQTAGKTSHSVVPLRGAKSAYQVVTLAGIASVHGTNFSVAVGEDGMARFAVNTGKVMVSSPEAELALEAGQVASTKPGSLPEAPDYQIELKGQLTSLDGDIWTVNGVSFTDSANMQIAGDPVVGSFVEVEGRITEQGERLADSVTVADKDKSQSTFTGILQTIEGDTWLVDGTALHVDENMELGEGIELGKPVKVTFYVAADGRWMATEIESLEEEEPLPTEPPVVTEPITPTETVTSTEIVTPTPFTNCTGANPHPKGTSLAGKYGVSPDEIMGWFCQHFGFGEIDLAYGLSQQYGVSVEQIFALRRTGLGWGQIKQMLAAGLITPTPVITPTTVPTVTVTPTTTVVLTTTETPTTTLATPTPLPSKNNRSCPQQDNPTAQRLAAQYGVPPEEIMGWFCRGFGFGEIDQAYSLSLQYGIPVADIFAMRAGGMGWGKIRQQLQAAASPAPMMTQQPGNGQGNPGHTPPGQNIPGHRKPPKKK